MNLAALIANFENSQKEIVDHLMDIKTLLMVLDHDPTQPGSAPRTRKIQALLRRPPDMFGHSGGDDA